MTDPRITDLVAAHDEVELAEMYLRLQERTERLEGIRELAWKVIVANQPMLLGTVENDLYSALCYLDCDFAALAEVER